MKLKKILVVIDETNFYHPQFFYDLYQGLKSKNYEISVGLITKVKEKNSIEKYLLKNTTGVPGGVFSKKTLKYFNSL